MSRHNIQEKIDSVLRSMDVSTEQANNGNCDEFAWELHALLVGSRVINPDYDDSPYWGHFFVRWNGRYYDAETPNGVVDFEDLRIYSDIPRGTARGVVNVWK